MMYYGCVADERPFDYIRRRYVVMYSPSTKRGLILDTFKFRLWKMRARIFAWAALVKDYQSENDTYLKMMTLTYANGDDWSSGHIREFIKWLKYTLEKDLLAFAWAAEIQERGAVHYHVLALTPKTVYIPFPDEYWKFGRTGIENARTPYYLVMYTGKSRQKDLSRFPKSCRTYAASIRFGDQKTKEMFREMSYLNKKEWDIEDWEFRAATVTEGYGRYLLPVGTEI